MLEWWNVEDGETSVEKVAIVAEAGEPRPVVLVRLKDLAKEQKQCTVHKPKRTLFMATRWFERDHFHHSAFSMITMINSIWALYQPPEVAKRVIPRACSIPFGRTWAAHSFNIELGHNDPRHFGRGKDESGGKFGRCVLVDLLGEADSDHVSGLLSAKDPCNIFCS